VAAAEGPGVGRRGVAAGGLRLPPLRARGGGAALAGGAGGASGELRPRGAVRAGAAGVLGGGFFFARGRRLPPLGHFHPPLSERRHWHAFHNSWATYLSSQLNTLLPEGYFAEANVQFGVEIDEAAFEEHAAAPAPAGWTPPATLASFPLTVPGAVIE